MIAHIEIRSETNKDIQAIADVTAAAFQSLEVSKQTERYIIEALRAAKALNLSLVAEFEDRDRSVELYDEWAPVYEEDLVGGYGYESPWIAAEYFAGFCPETRTRIMDFGCGTGLSGQALAAKGYARIDGLDVSERMLREARKKGVYQNLVRADFTDRTGLADASYEAAICFNAFGNGHLRPEHLGEMIRTVQEGGLFVFFINARPYEDDEYPACFQRLQDAGIWRIEKTACINYMRELDRPGWVVVARRQAAAL